MAKPVEAVSTTPSEFVPMDCPKCGSCDTSLSGRDDQRWVECRRCEYGGPSAKTKDGAIAAWNLHQVSTPLPQQGEPAEQAWNRAFQYVNRHGWTSELDGIPHYTAPKEFRNSPIAPLLGQDEPEIRLPDVEISEDDQLESAEYVAAIDDDELRMVLQCHDEHLTSRERQLTQALASLAAAQDRIKTLEVDLKFAIGYTNTDKE